MSVVVPMLVGALGTGVALVAVLGLIVGALRLLQSFTPRPQPAEPPPDNVYELRPRG